jgi:hypothetical protein
MPYGAATLPPPLSAARANNPGRGVDRVSRNRWRARLWLPGERRQMYLGLFESELLACRALREARERMAKP